MIDKKINKIIDEIKTLEDELVDEIKKREKEFFYKIENGKVQFEHHVIQEGKSKIISSIRYLSSFPVLAIFTIPFIWSMIVPIAIIDLLITIYQWVCFPIYKIPKIKRSDYVVIGRYRLFYLDKVEKINCWYCEYFNGVIAYVREISARTEQFWCPIKHSKALRD
ncbi:hypothetical protein GSY74_00430, partial [Sulfurovum sp. bin170]|uniref:hypothetical protein n=1 Tax=Sulfurovum sp. bin170 TaxID=2695268 RepID=UPI0013E08637